MKKIIFSTVFLFFTSVMFLPCLAEDTTMPSDKEIMEAIEKFNFDDSQKEFLFKETKKKLEQMQKNGEMDALIKQQMADGDFDSDSESKYNSSKKAPNAPKQKKYASHDPLVKKQHVGQRKNSQK